MGFHSQRGKDITFVTILRIPALLLASYRDKATGAVTSHILTSLLLYILMNWF
jgi:hypothetical protein